MQRPVVTTYSLDRRDFPAFGNLHRRDTGAHRFAVDVHGACAALRNAAAKFGTRQSGLLKEMQSVANNIANIPTTGYRREGVVFSEHVRATGSHTPSLSFADAHGRLTDLQQGMVAETGGTFDFAIEGPGYFLISTPDGERLTRAGAFTPNQTGDLVTSDGHPVLDSGGAPIFIPPDAAEVSLAPDGTLSADGRPLAQIGIVLPNDPRDMIREKLTASTSARSPT